MMLSSEEDNMKKFEWKSGRNPFFHREILRVVRIRTTHDETRFQKTLVSFFLRRLFLQFSAQCQNPEPGNRCFSSDKTKQKKETSKRFLKGSRFQEVFQRFSVDIFRIWSLLEPWTLDLKPWTLNLEPWALNLEPRTLKLEPWNLNLEPWTLNLETWTLKLETWTLKLEPWNLNLETWTLNLEPWNLKLEPWT